ncbi:MAG: sporulation protein YqfD, partial [Clostridia bacterium]|nr:sporulation protein YqfD [Clostridia bacterium]
MVLDEQKITYKVKGLNFKKFLMLLKKEAIEVCLLKKQEYNIFFIQIKQKDVKSFIKIASELNYRLIEENSTILLNSKKSIIKNLSFFITVVLLGIILVFSCNMVYKIEIYGLETLSPQQVVKVLNDNNIKVFKTKSSYNLDNIELLLKSSLDKISFASAIIKGNTMIINVNEKINNDEYIYDYQPIVATYDCIIKNINLKSGTVVVEKGQTVKKGQEIVMPYIDYKDGTQLSVKASAEIEAYIEVSHTTQYLENHTAFVRTGNKIEVEQLDLYNLNLKKEKTNVHYKNFETELNFSYPFNNFILPIKKTITTYYELKERKNDLIDTHRSAIGTLEYNFTTIPKNYPLGNLIDKSLMDYELKNKGTETVR